MSLRHPSATLIALILLALPLHAAPINTGTLLREMASFDHLTHTPSPFFHTIQYSSYDRTSNEPGGPGWFANSDGFGGEPIPNFESVLKPATGGAPGEYLICDVRGPGAIVRVWTAIIEGDVQVYLDGSDTPLFAGKANDFFTRPYAAWLPQLGIDENPLWGTFYQSHAGYCPIPFAKQCRIVWIGDPAKVHFYQVQIRKYEASAQVQTFTPEDLKTYAQDLQNTLEILADPSRSLPQETKEHPIDLTLPPGATIEAFRTKEPGKIAQLTLNVTGDAIERALRGTILHIAFDKAPHAQVQSPLGDFFGAAPGLPPYSSLPFTIEGNTLTSRFPMPFASEAKLLLQNTTDTPIHLRGAVHTATHHQWDPDTSMHFRARWRNNPDITGSADAPQDMPYLIARGEGQFVGAATYLMNPNDVPTPGGNWWGEGDEKIFVDGDSFPSTFGTGSEDYYNYAWSSPDLFAHPYCGQPRNDGPANRGFVTNYRWHILDPLPFRERFAFYMELFTHETTPGMAYATIAYYYARPGAIDDHVVIQKADATLPTLPPWEPAARAAASNTNFLWPNDVAQTPKALTTIEGPLYARGKLYQWNPTSPEDSLTFNIEIPRNGRYLIGAVFAQDEASGIFRAEIGGKKLRFNASDQTSLYARGPQILRLFTTGVELSAGAHQLTLHTTGKDPAATASNIALNFLYLRRD